MALVQKLLCHEDCRVREAVQDEENNILGEMGPFEVRYVSLPYCSPWMTAGEHTPNGLT